MPGFLRVVDGNRWDFVDKLTFPYDLAALPAAPFGDLKTSATNLLSVWWIEDGDWNLDRVIAGFAANRALDLFNARIVDVADVEALGIKSKREGGHSRDKEANRRWHHNLVDLTHQKVDRLADLLICKARPIERDEDELPKMIATSIMAGHFTLEELHPSSPSTKLHEAVTRALRVMSAEQGPGQP